MALAQPWCFEEMDQPALGYLQRYSSDVIRNCFQENNFHTMADEKDSHPASQPQKAWQKFVTYPRRRQTQKWEVLQLPSYSCLTRTEEPQPRALPPSAPRWVSSNKTALISLPVETRRIISKSVHFFISHENL